MVSRRVLSDVGLGLLAVVTIGTAGYVLQRTPEPPAVSLPAPAATATASPSPVAGIVVPTPSSAPVRALLLRSGSTPAAHVLEAARTLGWSLAGGTLAEETLLTGRDVVLVQAGQSDQQDVLAAVRRVRATAPAVRLVVLAPLVPVTGGSAPTELAAATRAAGAELLDPAALGWVQDSATVFTSTGAFTPQGATSVGEKLADALDD